jgi:hypothetical protein
MKLAQTIVLNSSIIMGDSLLTAKYGIIYKCLSLAEPSGFLVVREMEAAGLSETLVQTLQNEGHNP